MLKPAITHRLFPILVFSFLIPFCAKAQGFKIQLRDTSNISKEYEDKLLPSEKTDEKSFGFMRRFMQNTTSRYNFFFNANNKLNAVIEGAKMSAKEDYTALLPFYGYSLDQTSANNTELDSVILKSTAGILLHDLRTDWVDNFYFLIGKSYYLKKNFDSAAMTFQFINYNLYPKKKGDDGYNRYIGSNIGQTEAGKRSLSVADKEKRNFLQKAVSLPHSRNDALIWQIRTYIQQNELSDAAGLISILQNDENLPTRLKNDLEEVTAYWFYVQNIYDSSANHLAKALTNADNKADRARWEYLTAQMYELSGKYDQASQYYAAVSKHTDNPVLDIYARLSEAKMLRTGSNEKELDRAIDNLLRMARRERYDAYRDVIYYSAAQLNLQRPDTASGMSNFARSISYTGESQTYRDRSYLQMGNIAFARRDFRNAYSFYDSITGTPGNPEAMLALTERKEILSRLVPLIEAVEREDSLQRIAAMSAEERDAFIKKLVRQYRKSQGLTEEDDFAGKTLITFANNKAEPVDLFKSAAAGPKDWYFYNANLKSRGFSQFKSKWGKRTNVDNWRRKTTAEAIVQRNGNQNIDIDATIPQDGSGRITSPDVKTGPDYSYDGLLAHVPLTSQQLDSSNIMIANALMNQALLFQNELSDYPDAIIAYEEFLRRFKNDQRLADVYLNLSYDYSKIPDPSKSAFYRNLLLRDFSTSAQARLATDPGSFATGSKNQPAAARYESIYQKFIEGDFAAALADKKKADSLYGQSHWTPQLLYIESVYYIRERQDSNAIAALQNVVKLYPASPLKAKAETMIDVLRRRSEIEKYLSDLQVTRAEEDVVIVRDDVKAAPIVRSAAPAVPQRNLPVVPAKKLSTDSLVTPQVFKMNSFTFKPDDSHMVVMILDKVDGVYVNEAKNAFDRFNRESVATSRITIKKDAVDAQNAFLLFNAFPNATDAVAYVDRIRRAAPREVSWLAPAKYSFLIISQSNLEVLKTTKDIAGYRKLLSNNFAGKF